MIFDFEQSLAISPVLAANNCLLWKPSIVMHDKQKLINCYTTRSVFDLNAINSITKSGFRYEINTHKL